MIDPSSSSDTIVWLDGAFVPLREATLPLVAHHYGVGVFEGVRSYQGDRGASVFRLDAHTRRLIRSAHILGIPLRSGIDAEALNAAQCEVLRRSRLGDAYIRPFIFYDGITGLSLRTDELTVRVAVVALPWPKDGAAYRDAAALARGISAHTSSFMRHHANSLLTHAKANGNYMNSILALQEARRSGVDEAILLDSEGFVTEGTGANLFVVRDGALHTPPACYVLEGITRDSIFTLAAEAKIPVVERRLTRDDLYVADEVFLTGTAAEVTAIREIDHRKIGSGQRGPVTRLLQETYAAEVHGRGTHGAEWLTPI